MAILFDAPVEPDALTSFTRQVPVRLNNALSMLFPRRTVMDNQIDWSEIVQTNRTAKYRAFDGRIVSSGRDTATNSRVKLAPLSDSSSIGEYERLQMEFARTGGTLVTALENAIYNDAARLTGNVLNRLELGWGDVLTDGKLTINENGLQSEADYGVPGSHIVAPGTLWSNLASSTPLTDMLAWSDTYYATNGERPAQALTSLRVKRYMQRNAEVINAAYGSAAGRTRVTDTDLDALLTTEGLPRLLMPYENQLSVDGSSTRVIADDKFVMLPANVEDLGSTVMGVTATALELVSSNEAEMSFEESAGIVGVVIKEGPPFRQFVFVDAVGMPVLTNAKLLMVADVA